MALGMGLRGWSSGPQVHSVCTPSVRDYSNPAAPSVSFATVKFYPALRSALQPTPSYSGRTDGRTDTNFRPQKVTANELDSILSAERTSPMIIDFYATWCGPCVVLAQELEQLAVEYGQDIRFLKVDTDEEHELASQMEIRGLPTLVFVSKDVDKLAIRTEGLLPTDAIRDIIEKEILI